MSDSGYSRGDSMAWTNLDAAHRHAFHALEDFEELRNSLAWATSLHERELLHAIGHHLRHAVYRTGLELDPEKRRPVGRNIQL